MSLVSPKLFFFKNYVLLAYSHELLSTQHSSALSCRPSIFALRSLDNSPTWHRDAPVALGAPNVQIKIDESNDKSIYKSCFLEVVYFHIFSWTGKGYIIDLGSQWFKDVQRPGIRKLRKSQDVSWVARFGGRKEHEINKPYAPCMEYIPTFTQQMAQM
jgi:hypothetical protein